MKPKWMKLFSVVLSLVLVVQMLPVSVWAVDALEEGKTALTAAQAQKTELKDAVVLGEITENRTEYTKEFRLDNGMILATVYGEPVHFEKAGQWEEIDNTLIPKIGGYTNTQGVWNVTLPNDLGNGSVSVEKDGYTLSFQMAGRLTQTPGLEIMSEQNEPLAEVASLLPSQETVSLTLDGASETLAVSGVNASQASLQEVELGQLLEAVQYPETVVGKNTSALLYTDVYQGTDVRYDLQSNRVKESIIMEAYSSTLRGYRYTLNVGKLLPVLQDDGSVVFYSPEGESEVFYMPAPFLVDANGQISYDVRVSLTGSKGEYSLVYLLPRAWLGDSQRTWPVVLDPQVQPSIQATNIQDISFNTNTVFSYGQGTLDCGYRLDKASPSRSLVKFRNLPTLTSSDVIVAASMRLYKPYNSTVKNPVEAHKVLGTWESETMTFATIPAFDETVEDYALVQSSGYYTWDITDIARGWYAGENTGVLFKADNANEQNTSRSCFKEFYASNWGTPAYIPNLAIAYRNNDGIESYWDYSTASAGRAGTGYVNTFTGNLAWIRGDMGFDGNRMPVSIQHVYNLNDASANDFGLGYGWRTNYHQRVYTTTLNSTTYYVWEDADGTSHYFKNESTGVYKHEDNEKLTIRTSGVASATGVTGGQYSLTDGDGNVSVFDSQGRLIRSINNQKVKSSIAIAYRDTTGNLISTVTDGVGRTYSFGYTDDRLTSLTYKGTGTDPLATVTYSYTDGNLTAVTDQDGKVSAYTYSGHILQSASDIDGYKLTYDYEIPSGDYQPYRVKKVTEYDGTIKGGELSLSYAHNETTLTDGNGNRQILQYNDFGNVVSIQDGEGRAQYSKYLRNTEDDSSGKANQLQLSSKLQYTVSNLLTDSSFENGTVWCPAGVYAEDNTVTDTQSYQGSHSLMISANTSAVGPQVTVEPGGSYSFSAWVKTVGGTAWLQLGTQTSEVLPTDSDWTRLELSYTNTESFAMPIQPQIYTSNGTDVVYVDCVQFEKTPTASRYNLIQNGDFREGMSGWTGSSYSVVQGTAAAPQLDASVAKVTGNTEATQRLSQTVPVSGKKDDTLVFAGWANGNSVSLTEESHDAGTRQFALIATFQYTDGTTGEFIARFNPDVSAQENWQYVSEVMVAKQDYSSVTLALAYDYNSNDVRFDGIQLYKEAFGSSYTYDDEGNVTSVVDLQGQITEYEYTNNDLTKQILPTGAELSYEYDSYHNVTKATSELGQVYEFTYDDWGNNLSVSLVSGESRITASATYTADGNLPASATDALGNVTTYGYDAQKGLLLWSKAPEDTDATRTEYTYDTMLRVSTAEATTDTGLELSAVYTYTDDLLTSIQTPSTTYSFGYGDFALRTSVSIGTRTLASYTYTAQNHFLQSLNYGNGDSVSYTYDSTGRLLTQSYEDGDTVSYSYDNSGALAKIQDSATGRTTTYYYDFTDRLMKYVEAGENYYHSIGYDYDSINNLTTQVENINGTEHTTAYTYDDDNRVTSKTTDGITVTYTYDGFGRVSQQETKNGETLILTESFTYTVNENGTPTSQVASYTTTAAGYTVTYTYTYDKNGNILSINDGTYTISYEYDSANQLVRVNNQKLNHTRTWTYDSAGNIQKMEVYSYTTGELGRVLSEVPYSYEDTQWDDLLTAYISRQITYDEIGNMLSYNNKTFTWEHGRQLAALSASGTTWSFAYNSDGLRTGRTDGTNSYSYVYNGSQLVQMKYNDNTLYFTYDASGTPLTVTYNGTTYYYATNIQGDVVAILDSTGTAVVNYIYDSWGKALSRTGSMASTLGKHNPLRYRGYVYDNETGLYYLQSRYYDPEWGRFVNADAKVSTGQKFIGHNMMTYCLNNPVNCHDPDGCDAIWLQEESNAMSMGHTGLLVEDGEGKWYLYYWGPASYTDAILHPFGTELKMELVEVKANGYEIENAFDAVRAVYESNDKFIKERRSQITDGIYLKGDYTKTYEYLQTTKEYHEYTKDKNILQYGTLNRNCVQTVCWALEQSDSSIGLLGTPLIPNIAYLKMKRMARLRIIFYG